MDLKERSPSFVGLKISKTSEKSSSQKMKFKPMPSMQLLQSLKMYSPTEQPSSTKKLNIKPARTNELNLDEFKKSPKITTRNVRKQLWSVEKGDSKWTVEKGDKLRRVTVMKPGRESLRKSVYSRPSMIQPKKNTQKQSKCLSIDDTLPLMDMEQFTVTKIKRTLFSAQQSKPLNQRKTTSHINVNKMPMVSSFARKIMKPTATPTIVITPVEKSVKKSVNKTTHIPKPKIENEKKNDTMDTVSAKLANIEDKLGSFDDIKALLCTICIHLGIEVPVNFLAKQQKPDENEQIPLNNHFLAKQQKPEEKEQIPLNKSCSIIKREISSPCSKRDVSSTPLPTINENLVNNTEFKETVYKLSPFIKKHTSNISNETNKENSSELKFSPIALKVTNQLENIDEDTFTESNSLNIKLSSISKAIINSKLENNETDTMTESNSIKLLPSISKVSISNQLEKETSAGSKSNCEKHNDDDELLVSIETPLNLKDISPSTPTNQVQQNSLKSENMFTPNIDHKINNKSESTIKLKKSWITQFEQLENKLLNNSNESINLNSSPDNSPVQPLQIDKIVNDDYDKSALLLKKSQSTPNLLEGNASQRKNILFKSRETDVLTESICVYNKLRDELPKFLSTPVNKTNKTMTFMTPSVQGNEKKLISRRVQEQLLRLNDC